MAIGRTNASLPQGIPLEVPTNAGMVALLVASNIGKVYKFTGETDSDFTNGEIYEVVEE